MRLFISYMIIATALVAAAPAVAEPLAPHTVTVEGSAEILVAPDEAVVEIGVVTQDATAIASLRANNAEMTRVVRAIVSQGIVERDIGTSNFDIHVYHPKLKNGDDDRSRTSGYEVTNKVRVAVRDLSKVAGVIDSAVNAGANSSNSVTFDVTDRPKYDEQAQRAAMRDARRRAVILLGEENKKVGEVLSVITIPLGGGINVEGLLNNLPAVYSESTPILPEQVAIRNEVTVQFSIE